MNAILVMSLPLQNAAPSLGVTSLDDADLCRRSARGDDDAFAELCRRHAPALLRMALSMGLSRDDASDLTQEALCRVLEKRHFLASVTKVRAWLYRVALNLFHTKMRTHSRHQRLLTHRRHDVIGSEHADPIEPNAPVDTERFSKAVAGLTPMQQDVVTLRAGGLSFREVAKALGSSENACKVHMHNAVKRLKNQLGEAP